ncbi:hypothetical protein D6779_08480, partial [Candidatus Parcubacteria bacterium]
YNARWYDPQLGRFAQADTLIPGAAGPLAWDRYAYTLNNPLRYTDPGGHGACDGPYQVLECSQIANSDNKVPAPGPTSLNIGDLDSTPGGQTGISGLDFYQWYLELYNDTTTGWWWDVFGRDGRFTIWEAVALVLVSEAYGNWSNPYLAEAMVRAASMYGCGGGTCTTEQFINHFAHYYASAGFYVKKGSPPSNTSLQFYLRRCPGSGTGGSVAYPPSIQLG